MVEGTVGLVFSWNPKARTWVRERGPEDAALPPAAPIDDGAVQTYFLDPANGRWQATILGPHARMIASSLGNAYRSAMMPGLAYEEPPAKPRMVVEYETEARSRSVLRTAGALVVLVAAIGGGAIAANAVLNPSADVLPSFAPQAIATTLIATNPAASTAPSSAPAADGSKPAASVVTATTAPAAQVPVRTAAPQVAPQVAPATTVTYTTRLANGTTVTATGPSAVLQGAAWDGQLRANTASGDVAFDNMTVYLGPLGSAQGVTVKAGTNGMYIVSIKASVPKGDQPVSIMFGNNGELRILGSINVR